MKKLIFLVILAAVFTACGNSELDRISDAHSEIENNGVNHGQEYPEQEHVNNNR